MDLSQLHVFLMVAREQSFLPRSRKTLYRTQAGGQHRHPQARRISRPAAAAARRAPR